MFDDPRFLGMVEDAHNDLSVQLAAVGPFLGERLVAWMQSLAQPPQSYFTHVRAFPILLLPWLAQSHVAKSSDVTFQRSLAKATMAGYYHVRLIDDVMDTPATGRRDLLPALGILHSLFLEPYRIALPSDDPFHENLSRIWSTSADITASSWAATDFDRAGFEAGPGQKILAARIPLELVLHVHRRCDLQRNWERFIRTFGYWHQMEDDLLDWSDDLAFNRSSWFLSEAKRRAPIGIPAGAWILREGLAWGYGTLDSWWEDVILAAQRLACPGLDEYLAARQRASSERRMQLMNALSEARALFGRQAR